MNITLTTSTVNGAQIETVDARQLHDFLLVGRDFSTWIRGRIEEYGFTENEDYIEIPNSGEAQPWALSANRRDFALTIDMAKELAMVERTETGRQVRKYFIACEKAAKNKLLQHQWTPDQLANADNNHLICMREMSKASGASRKKQREIMRIYAMFNCPHLLTAVDLPQEAWPNPTHTCLQKPTDQKDQPQ